MEQSAEFFEGARKRFYDATPKERSTLTSDFLKWNVVQLVRIMWKHCLRPKIFEPDQDFPDWIDVSLEVNGLLKFVCTICTLGA